MKAGFFVQPALAFMFGLAAGLPQYDHNALERRAYFTTTETVTVTLPAVIVHVYGTSTWTEAVAAITPTSTVSFKPDLTTPIPTSKPLSAVVVESSSAPEFHSTRESEPSFQSALAVVSEPITSSPAEFGTESATQAPASPTTLSSLSLSAYSDNPGTATADLVLASPPSTSLGNGYGIGYNPYNNDGSCKDSASIETDVKSLQGYSTIRLYGTDCDQLKAVMQAVKGSGTKLLLGIYEVGSYAAAMDQADSVIDAVKIYLDNDWSSIHSVSVGNEAILHQKASVDGLLAILYDVKKRLKSFNVAVVTVESPNIFRGEGKKLCQASDYTAINAHPFFDKSGDWNDPRDAGRFTKLMSDLTEGCGNTRTVITESGWPHGSDLGTDYFTSNNLPVPSSENHNAAIESLKKAYADHKEDLIMFSAFDDLWKKDTGETMGVEHYWGIVQ